MHDSVLLPRECVSLSQSVKGDCRRRFVLATWFNGKHQTLPKTGGHDSGHKGHVLVSGSGAQSGTPSVVSSDAGSSRVSQASSDADVNDCDNVLLCVVPDETIPESSTFSFRLMCPSPTRTR